MSHKINLSELIIQETRSRARKNKQFRLSEKEQLLIENLASILKCSQSKLLRVALRAGLSLIEQEVGELPLNEKA